MAREDVWAASGQSVRLQDNKTQHVHQPDKGIAAIIYWRVARVNLVCLQSNLDISEDFRAQNLNVFPPLCGELRTEE